MIRTLIVEDEALAAEKLEQMIGEIDPGLHIVAKLESVKAAVDFLQKTSVDLIFLDIHLSDGISFRIFEQVPVTTPVIFTTAFDQYAIRAFKVNSIDYLLKPVSEGDLRAAIRKFRSNVPPVVDYAAVMKSLSKPEYQKRFMVNAGQKIRSIEVQEIAYCYADEKIVILQTHETLVKFPLDYTLDKLEEILNPDQFFRINRKLIVNFTAIRNMTPYSKGRIVLELQPRPPFESIVSIDRAAEFRNWLNR